MAKSYKVKDDNYIDSNSIVHNKTKLKDILTYSTQETKIGTWIDGKTLYRKVLVFTELASSYSIGSSITEIVSIKGIIQRKDVSNVYMQVGGRLNEPSWLSSFGTIQTLGTQKLNMYYGSSWTSTTFDKLIIILEYTKTTD